MCERGGRWWGFFKNSEVAAMKFNRETTFLCFIIIDYLYFSYFTFFRTATTIELTIKM